MDWEDWFRSRMFIRLIGALIAVIIAAWQTRAKNGLIHSAMAEPGTRVMVIVGGIVIGLFLIGIIWSCFAPKTDE